MPRRCPGEAAGAAGARRASGSGVSAPMVPGPMAISYLLRRDEPVADLTCTTEMGRMMTNSSQAMAAAKPKLNWRKACWNR